MDISEITANRYFWGRQCVANNGGWSAFEVYNPVGSGVLLAVTAIELWCSLGMQYRLMSSDTPLPVNYGPRNSLYWPPSGPALSKCEFRAVLNGAYPGGNDIWILSDGGRHEFNTPWVIGEGRGVRVIPDSTGTFNLCASFLFAEL